MGGHKRKSDIPEKESQGFARTPWEWLDFSERAPLKSKGLGKQDDNLSGARRKKVHRLAAFAHEKRTTTPVKPDKARETKLRK